MKATQCDIDPVSTPGDDRPHRAIIILLICGIIALLDGADAQSLAICVPPIARQFGMSSATIGLLFSCTALGSAVGYLAGGVLTDRHGARGVVIGSAIVIGAFQLATALVGDVTSLIAIRIVVAVGLGGAVPWLIAIVGQVAPAQRRDRILGLIWACFPLGVLSGSLLNGWILHRAGWPMVFIVGGIAPVVAAVAATAFVPAIRGQRMAREAAPPVTTFLADGLWVRSLLAALIFFFTNGATAVIMSWTPTLLVRAGYAAEIGARLSACNAAGALISMALTGFLVERARVVPIVVGLGVAAMAMVACGALLHALTVVTIVMVLLGAALGLSGTAATFLPDTLLPPAHRSSGLGIGMAIGRAGQMLFPGVIGVILQGGASPGAAFLLTATLPAFGAVAAITLGLFLNRNAR